MKAYEDALSRCSTKDAPWNIVPSDRKWFRNLAVAEILVATMDAMKLHYPPGHLRPEDDHDRVVPGGIDANP